MRNPVATCILAGFSLALLPSLAAAEVGGALLQLFPKGEEACFGRAYDAAHLTKHPKQRVTAIHLFKSFTPDPRSEESDFPRAVQIARDRAEKPGQSRSMESRSLSVLVRLRDSPRQVLGQEVECQGADDEGFSCSVDCDGGSISLSRSGASLLLQPGFTGLRLRSSCDGDEAGDEIRLQGGEDDGVLQLGALPMKACHGERDAARPPWADGTPLRVRFAKRDGFCYARRYDAAHLARHPDQKVVALSLRTESRAAADEGDKQSPDAQDFPPDMFLSVKLSAKLRDGSVATKDIECRADGYRFACGDSWNFTLFRAGDRAVTLRDINYRKAIDETENYIGTALGLPLGDDDRVFRLEERADPACEPR